MLFHDNHQNPSVCVFLVQIRAIALFACYKQVCWVPTKVAGNPTHAKNVATLPSSRSMLALKTHKNGCGGAISVT